MLGSLQAKLGGLNWSHFLAAALVVGVLLRLIHYGLGRMLWLDEAMLTVNLVSRSGADLFAPLDFRQVAPPGWLILTDAFVDTTKNYAYGGRFPALIAGLAGLWVFYKICLSQLSKPAAFLAVAVFAGNFSAVYYSAEVKPYGFDMLLWLVLAWLALKLIDLERLSVSQIATLVGLFLIGSFTTFVAPIVVGAIGGCLIVNRYLKRDMRAVLMLGAGAAIAAVVFLILSLTIYKTQVDASGISDGGMGNYFSRLYAPFPPLSIDDIAWYPTVAEDLFADWFGLQSSFFMIFLAICGAVIMLRKKVWLAGFCLAPPVIAVVLSMAQLYPVMARLMLYMVPIIILLAAFALERLMQEAKGSVPVILAGAVVFMSLGSAANYAYESTFAPNQSNRDISNELATISEHVTEQDVVLLTRWSLPPYLLYRQAYGLQDQRWAIVERAACMTEPTIDHLAADRIWLINPFLSWRQLDNRFNVAPKSQADSSIVYESTELVEWLGWMRENELEAFPDDGFDCTKVRALDPFLQGGVAPIQLGAFIAESK